MSDQQNDTRQQLFAERLATIEANNEYQKQSLKQISQTLERVVETQAKLANQQEAINTLSDDLSYLRKTVGEQETTIRIISMKLEKAIQEIDSNKAQIGDLRGRVLRNETITKQVAWVFTAVLAPLAIYTAQSLISMFVG